MKSNAFSSNFDKNAARANLKKGQTGPKEGTEAYKRMIKAQKWAKGKIDQLYVEIPKVPGAQKSSDGVWECTFGAVFEHYSHIDSVIVGNFYISSLVSPVFVIKSSLKSLKFMLNFSKNSKTLLFPVECQCNKLRKATD